MFRGSPIRSSSLARTLIGVGVALAALTLLVLPAGAQPKSDKLQWSARLEGEDVRAGESGRVLVTVVPKEGWHVYAMNQPEGPVSTSFQLDGGPLIEPAGSPIEPTPQRKYDRGFKMEIGYHEGPTTFAVPFRVKPDASGSVRLVVRATAQACDATSCDIPTTEELTVDLKLAAGAARPERATPSQEAPPQPQGHVQPQPTTPQQGTAEDVDSTTRKIEEARGKGLLAYLWLSFVAGLLALLTPCVWPMIPVTVSFFSKKTEEGAQKNLKMALAYCLGIMGTFTALGLIVTLAFGAAGLQRFAASPWVNLALAALFVVLALNLFGVYEIVVPSWMLNKAQAGSQRSGIAGPIFMGLAFSITSFTCTVPFVGTILVAATKGNLWDPILGMLAFSLAFAIPFFLLALFPQYLASMPRSGTWLTAVKAYMGFLELAAALKFLQSAEIVVQLGWLTRPVFLAVWFAIFVIAGLYLLGWLRLPHGGEPKIGPARRLFGVANLGIAVYLLAAIEGAPLGGLSGFLPPERYPYRADGPKGASQQAGAIRWIENYEQGLALARQERRALFINFTGYTCTNCRVMEGEVFPKPEVARRINEFIPVELFTDNGTPENNRNAELRERLTKASTNPTYVILAPDGKVLKVFQGLALSDAEFVRFLDEGKREADAWFARQKG